MAGIPARSTRSYLGMTQSTREPTSATARRMERGDRGILGSQHLEEAIGSRRIGNRTRESDHVAADVKPARRENRRDLIARSTSRKSIAVRLRTIGAAGSPVEPAMTMSLIHLDVALAVEAHQRKTGDASDGASCFRVSAKRLARKLRRQTGAAEKFEDPVIRRLADALAATEAAHDSHSAIRADAFRLAIVTRQVSGQARPRATEDDAAEDSMAGM